MTSSTKDKHTILSNQGLAQMASSGTVDGWAQATTSCRPPSNRKVSSRLMAGILSIMAIALMFTSAKGKSKKTLLTGLANDLTVWEQQIYLPSPAPPVWDAYDTGTSTMKVHWTPVAGAVSYKLYWTDLVS